MDTKKIVVIGNQDLSYAIIGALFAPPTKDGKPAYCISVLTYPSHSPYIPPHVPPNAIDHRTSDFSSQSLESVFAGQNLVISTIAGGDYDLQVRIIDAAIAAGVKRFIPHEFAQDSLNRGLQERIPRSQTRARIIDYLRGVSITHTAFEWVAVAVGCILDKMLVSGDLGFDLQWESATIHGTGTEKFAATSLGRVGVVIASVVRNWHMVKNQFVYAAGVLVSANEVLASLERSTTSTWSVGYSTVDDCIREGELRIERGFPDSGMFLMERSILYDESLNAANAFQHQSVNGLLQLESETVEAIVGEAYHVFKHRGKPGCGCE
ncbi:isoflavone reductase family protein [Melanomma pulvis-pyrius CBS 109.77]|uniref:Isoflavone reductase family protein n=1 Tax=Melanomma pulvis-pyrius CBS 109.77 TaxID=1314802 RepID=A0A6A6XG31_9PLEO|nr:isoflavone reductase family protein [Melanomma pulvis-pyrius CBS 109.77]